MSVYTSTNVSQPEIDYSTINNKNSHVTKFSSKVENAYHLPSQGRKSSSLSEEDSTCCESSWGNWVHSSSELSSLLEMATFP